MSQNKKEKILVYPGAGLDFSPLIMGVGKGFKYTMICNDNECDCEKVHKDNSECIVKEGILEDITNYVFMDIEDKQIFDNTLDLANFIKLYLTQYFKVEVVMYNKYILHCKIIYCDFYELEINPNYDYRQNKTVDFFYLFGVNIYNLDENLKKICNKADILYQLGFWPSNQQKENILIQETILANLFKNVNTIICQTDCINKKLFNKICNNKIKWIYSDSQMTTFDNDIIY